MIVCGGRLKEERDLECVWRTATSTVTTSSSSNQPTNKAFSNAVRDFHQ